MRILYISWYFPPTNTIAARRTGKMVKRFVDLGCSVEVLTGVHVRNPNQPDQMVKTVPFYDLDGAINPIDHMRRLKGGNTKASGQDLSVQRSKKVYRQTRIWKWLREIYTYGALFPDKHTGWGRHLKPAVEEALERFEPDLVYVSAPPHSQVLHVSSALAGTGTPWVAEFRDLWAHEPFPHAPEWRRWLDKIVERRALKTAAGIVTVSDPWAEHYRRTYPKIPAHTTMNGFDPKDFSFDIEQPEPSKRVEVIYAGALYPGRRDPSPLFQAIQQSNLTPEDIRVSFYTDYNNIIEDLAHKFEVTAYVKLNPPTDYYSILKIQKQSDILLLLQWTDPRNNGNVPAKVFEQLALRRPILCIGPLEGVPARLIRERNAGLVAIEPDIITEYITAYSERKKETGLMALLPPSVCEGLERDTQFNSLYTFLETLLKTEK